MERARMRSEANKGSRSRKLPFAEPGLEKAAHILEEATRVQLQNFGISAAFLLRAFLEMT